MEGELVHIYMITYNHAPYIAQAIESALMQKTNFKYKLIIGEDCSTDGTREIVKAYAEKYPDKIKAYLNETNLGPIKNAIQIYKACTAKYIAMLEGDDYWTDPYKLQKQVDFLEANPEYGLVHSDWDILFTKTNKIIKCIHKTKNKKIPKDNFFENLLLYSYIGTRTVCVRKDLVEKFLNQHSKRLEKWKMGDLPLWLYIAKYSQIGYINQSLAVKRHFQESMSNSKDKRKRFAFKKSSYDIRFYFANIYGCSESTKLELKKQYNEFNLKYSVLLKNKKEAKKSFNFLKKNENDYKKKILYYFLYFGSINFFFENLIRYLFFLKEKLKD
ncbi:MAG: glycosyltransferase [Candidatus Helarchaeota archaeon]